MGDPMPAYPDNAIRTCAVGSQGYDRVPVGEAPFVRVLGVIPARGGSKGIPRKNLALLGGRPLLAHAAEAAAQSKRLTRVILSTDDAEIAAVGRSFNVEAPFMRPAELAKD